MESRIRAKSLAVIVRPADGALLVTEGGSTTGGRFARPLGGSIEFGELAVDAVKREMHEELGCELASAALLGVLENRFVLNGVPGHEIIFAFRCAPADASIYARDSIPVLDVPGLLATWWTPAEGPQLVPGGLAGLLGKPATGG